MLVEPPAGVNDIRRCTDCGWKRLEQCGREVSPRFSSVRLNECLGSLFSRLLRRKCRPLVIAVLERMLRMPQVAESLLPPVAPAIHGVIVLP